MRENIEQIGASRLNITQKLHAIKTFELPRIDFRMMCGDITQSDLRSFDSWLRGQIASWLGTRNIVIEAFLMSWRDGGFTIPSLEERQHTMIIRTILDVMSTSDRTLLKIMRQFEKEEAEVYGCTIAERQQEEGGFLRGDGPLPDLRSSSRKPSGELDAPQPEGERTLHPTLLKDLSVFPRALKAMQELGLSICMNDVTPCLRHVKLGKDFTSSKITRPAMWITQEVVRKLAFHSFHNAAQCSAAWKEFENNPTGSIGQRPAMMTLC
jgi:hypothetical protein